VEGGDYLKVHETGRAFAQELRFYKEAHSAGTPTLLQVFEEKKALLLSGVTGEPTSELAPEERLIAHRQAGQFLRQLHEIPLNDTDIPLNDALLSRLESGRKRLGPGVPLEELQELIRQRNLTRNWCHGDFMEHNWLWNGTIYVFDFEHAKPDYWLLDLCQLNSRVWFIDDTLKQAFWDGYGRRPDEWEERFLQLWTHLWALQTRHWALRHNDHRYLEIAETVLCRYP